jgi:hypothetical protein
MNEPQEWREIVGFNGYSVSDAGHVRNDDTGRIMRTGTNQRGIVNVGLMHRGVQYKKSVAVLVADAFVTTARSLEFNTPINLDGDRTNNRATNLLWRPRYFARKFFQQFGQTALWHINNPLMDLKTEEVFKDSTEAVKRFGLLHKDIYLSIAAKTYVWPTYQIFQILDGDVDGF